MQKFKSSVLQFLSKFDDLELHSNVPYESVFEYYYSRKHKIYIHLVENNERLKSIPTNYFQQISLHCYHHKIKLIHLREEQWNEKKDFIKHRLKAIFEQNIKIHARQCKIRRIDKLEYDLFLNKNHLLQSAKTRYKYGLFKKDELFGVMGISAGRMMTKENDLRKSFEIIRFATKTNHTIVGGFSKFLKYVELELNVEEWMSYYDLDWVVGNVYEKMGFELKQISKPIKIMIDDADSFTYNSGNLKLIKRVS